jgi:hypothetical protein
VFQLLSALLEVRRESASLAANELRGAGAIEYRRATVAITDRRELEEHSCSCYPAVTEKYTRFLTAELRGRGHAGPEAKDLSVSTEFSAISISSERCSRLSVSRSQQPAHASARRGSIPSTSW